MVINIQVFILNESGGVVLADLRSGRGGAGGASVSGSVGVEGSCVD